MGVPFVVQRLFYIVAVVCYLFAHHAVKVHESTHTFGSYTFCTAVLSCERERWRQQHRARVQALQDHKGDA